MYDVIVAGAGPAGSTCARLCAKQGLRTLLLDKDRFPRSKTCAGAVSEQALMYLDFPLPHWVIERECFGARLSLG
ncbi:MAG TPA: geranylgeranyl reductase, partial [Nitrospiraceae bacterium]|nr:geranylgeranyl reductase [Nitrospiraceae bacterium]